MKEKKEGAKEGEKNFETVFSDLRLDFGVVWVFRHGGATVWPDGHRA
ncbi:hypothetical protein A2U01_0072389, partial [Trifolium medium]|nr:hypothetical protein [Trifolium medium]